MYGSSQLVETADLCWSLILRELMTGILLLSPVALNTGLVSDLWVKLVTHYVIKYDPVPYKKQHTLKMTHFARFSSAHKVEGNGTKI